MPVRRDAPPIVPARLFRRLLAVRQRLEEHLDAPITLAGLARDAGISRAHLLRQYRRVFGRTPTADRAALRWARAQALLAQGRSVTATAAAVGFASLGSFSTGFRRRFGCSPQACRRQWHHAAASAQVPWCVLVHAGVTSA